MKYPILIFIYFLCPLYALTQNVEVAGKVIADSLDISSGVIKNVADPTNPQDMATKLYVDMLEGQLNTLKAQLFEAGLVSGTISDIDGNVYKTIKIGDQVWMLENLRTTRYNDGTSIPLVTDAPSWSALSTPGYSFYDTTGTNYTAYSQDTFGALYNYYAVADTNSLNVCPIGWHVPGDEEWTALSNVLGGTSVAGGPMKEAGLTHWNSPNTGATNESRFSALPGGNRAFNGAYSSIGIFGYWWSSSEFNTSFAWSRRLDYNTDDVVPSTASKRFGFSVRCVRD